MNINTMMLNKKIYVFFDVDDTLITVKSMLSFQDFWFQIHPDAKAEKCYRQEILDNMHEGTCWKALNRLYYTQFCGRSVQEVERMGRLWFKKMRTETACFYHLSVVAELRAHQSAGHQIVFVSGSFPALLHPIAEELQVASILCTNMEISKGQYTGKILPPQTIAEGKAEAIEAFLMAHQASARHCYAYGDDWSDVPMLEVVGHPCVVAGGRGLEEHAHKLNWRVITPA